MKRKKMDSTLADKKAHEKHKKDMREIRALIKKIPKGKYKLLD